jgi:flagellar protein FliS
MSGQPLPPGGQSAHLSDRFHHDGAGSMSQERLLVMLYQRLLRDFDDAVEAMERRDYERSHFALLHAQKIVAELDDALDSDLWKGAAGLSQLYGYLLDLLVAANLRKDPRLVKECIALVAPVSEAWADAWTEVSTTAAHPGPRAAASSPPTDDGPEGQRLLDVRG